MIYSAMTPLLGVAVPTWVPPVLTGALLLTSLFLICLVLIQRGKGGGLAGAFGGAGGQSAFGSRAGDAFTKITIYTALVWILLIMFLIKSTQETGPILDRVIDRNSQRGGGGGGGGGDGE